MAEIDNPHDRLFRKTLADPQVVRDFIQHYLPKEMAGGLELQEAEPVQGTFVDERMREYVTDLVYRVSLADRDGRLCLEREHQKGVTRS